MTTQNPNLPPPSLLPPPQFNESSAEERRLLTVPPSVPGVILPQVATVIEHGEDPEEEILITERIEQVLGKSGLAEILKPELDAIDDADNDYANELAKTTVPLEYEEYTKLEKQEAREKVEQLLRNRLSTLDATVGETAHKIDKEHYRECDPDESGQRFLIIKPVLTDKLHEAVEDAIAARQPEIIRVVEGSTKNYREDPEYRTADEQVAAQIKDGLSVTRFGKKTKEGEEGEKLIGIDDAIKAVAEAVELYKPLVFVSRLEKRRADNATAIENAKAALTALKDRIIRDTSFLQEAKSKQMSQWLKERHPEVCDDNALSVAAQELAEGLYREVGKQFYDTAFQDHIRKTFIAPALLKKGLIERKRDAGSPVQETTPVVDANLEAKWVPEIIRVIKPTDIADVSAHIGRYLTLGGDPRLLAAAHAAVQNVDPEFQLAVIKGILFVTEQK